MDGKVLLLVCAGILGGAYFLGTEEITLGKSGGASKTPKASQYVIDVRHNEIRRTLRQEGYDLSDPASYVRERDGILKVGGPVAATEHGGPAFIEQVVSHYHRPTVSEKPGKVSVATPVEECRFSAPSSRSRLANVFANPSLHKASFFALDNQDLNQLADAFLAKIKAEGMPDSPGVMAIAAKVQSMQATANTDRSEPYRYAVTEVVVTETEAPVHLVLQAGAGRILWNIHLAKGAKVSGVSLLGGTLPAVANLPKGTDVEVMDEEGMSACGVKRVRLPLASDPIFQSVDNGSLSEATARETLVEMVAQVEVWNDWFAGQFGLRSDESRIGYDDAAIMAVIGPLPENVEALVPYHTLKNARVSMAEAEEVLAKDAGAASNSIFRLAEARAKELAGGDLAQFATSTN